MKMKMNSLHLLGTLLLLFLLSQTDILEGRAFALPPIKLISNTATAAWIIQATVVTLDKHLIQTEIQIESSAMTPTFPLTAMLNLIIERMMQEGETQILIIRPQGNLGGNSKECNDPPIYMDENYSIGFK